MKDILGKELFLMKKFFLTQEADTEENVLKTYNTMKEWHEHYDESLHLYIAMIEEALKVHSKESIQRMLRFFHDKKEISIYQEIPIIAYMVIIITIYDAEINEGTEPTFLDGRHSIAELIELFNRIKFLLWRMEFDMDEKSADLLLSVIEKNKISITAVTYILQSAGIDKKKLIIKAALLFKDRKKLALAFKLLKNASVLHPGEEIILCELAEICFLADNKDAAIQYLSQIKNVSRYALDLKKKWGLT